MRKTAFVEGEYYHVYNRGSDKRVIFSDEYDFARFLQSMKEFNDVEAIGSIFENSFKKDKNLALKNNKKNCLVNFVAYCLNKNHYHFILEQAADKGIEKFMQRLGNGYTKYYNNKYERSGVLFQGRFKSIHVATNEYLLHLSAYVNLNDRVHKTQLGHPMSKLKKTSWDEYVTEKNYHNFCKKDVVLNQFKNINEYSNFATGSLVDILERKEQEKEIENLLIE